MNDKLDFDDKKLNELSNRLKNYSCDGQLKLNFTDGNISITDDKSRKAKGISDINFI